MRILQLHQCQIKHQVVVKRESIATWILKGKTWVQKPLRIKLQWRLQVAFCTLFFIVNTPLTYKTSSQRHFKSNWRSVRGGGGFDRLPHFWTKPEGYCWCYPGLKCTVWKRKVTKVVEEQGSSSRGGCGWGFGVGSDLNFNRMEPIPWGVNIQ